MGLHDGMNTTWKYMPLNEAAEICDSQRKPINSKERNSRIAGKSASDLYPYYGATGQVGYIDDYITDGEYVLLGEDGAPFLSAFADKAYIINGKTWVNNHAHILKSKTNNKFLCYYLNSFNYEGYVSGTTRLKLTQASMKQIQVPVPSMEEQQRIVSKIEELFSQLDSGIETLKKTKEQLEIYRLAVLKEAFSEYKNWEKCSFQSLMTEVRNGYGAKPTDYGSYKILRISSVRATNLNLFDYRLNAVSFEEKDTIKENDLLFTRYNGSVDFVGVCAYVPELNETYAYPDKLIKCRPKINSTIHSKYLQYYMSQGEARNYIRSKIKTTSGQNGISSNDIKKTIVYIPNLEVQEKIVSKIETQLSICENIENTIDKTLQEAEALRQSILKQAFGGRL